MSFKVQSLPILLSGNKELSKISPVNVYNNRRICKKHFVAADFGPNNHLLQGAYPKLNPPVLDPVEQNGDTQQNQNGECCKQIETEPMYKEIQQETAEVICSVTSDQDAKVAMSENVLNETVYQTPPRRSRQGILNTVDVTREEHLTPKARCLYRQVKYQKHMIESCKKQLRMAKHYSKQRLFEKLTSSMDVIKTRFFASQIANCTRSNKGHRFTLDDKILALALQKQTGSGYKLLSKLFALPSRRTLSRLLQRIPIRPGLNNAVLEVLKTEVSLLQDPLDKYCILIFDEMSICPNLFWNKSEDFVEGFENFGYRTTSSIANHAQVYMLRGIKKKWKQPIYYSFVNGPTKSTEIVRTIKETVDATQQAGLEIIATVCDQGTNNVSAIKTLISDTAAEYMRHGKTYRKQIMEINGRQIIPLFDVPHLIKGIRNNFLKSNINYCHDKQLMVAKWDHINKAWLIDSSLGSLRMMPKLTSHHVDPAHIKKMKVSCATQVLSRSVAVGINIMALSGTSINLGNETIKMPPEGVQTAKFIRFCDDLFDSLNGATLFNKQEKTFRTAVQRGSPHLEFWVTARQILSSMQFHSEKGKIVPPSVKNFITTLNGFEALFHTMTNIGFKNMMPHTFNQDCLENFFGSIRQRGARFTNPTAAAFTPFLKSLLINNFTANHSVGSNCEQDNSKLLITLKRFVKQATLQNNNEDFGHNFVQPNIQTIKLQDVAFLESCTISYVAGYVIKKLHLKLSSCLTCRDNVLCKEANPCATYHTLTLAKEYGGATSRRLKYVNGSFYTIMEKLYKTIRKLLPVIIHQRGFFHFIIAYCKENIIFNFQECNHAREIIHDIVYHFATIIIFNYIKHVNSILNGKYRKTIPNSADKIFHSAYSLRKRFVK